MKFLSNQKGFTLIQLAVAVAIIAIVSGIALLSYKTISDQSKYEETRQKMALLQKGIMGDPTITEHGERISFGYLGDMGALPAALTALVSQGALPGWSYNPNSAACNPVNNVGTCNEGAGWRGPYIKGDFASSTDYLNDGWGNPIIYTPTANSFTLTSYGPDGVAGTGDDVVIAVNPTGLFAMGATNLLMVTVSNKGTPVTNATVTIYYSGTNGAVSSVQLVGNNTAGQGQNGVYTFSAVNIPYGARSLQVTGVGSFGPKPINVYGAHTAFNIDMSIVGGSGGVNGNANAQNLLPATGNNGIPGNNPINGPTLGPINAPGNPNDGRGDNTRAYMVLTNTSGGNVTITSADIIVSNSTSNRITRFRFRDWNTGISMSSTTVSINTPGTLTGVNLNNFNITNGQQVLVEIDFNNTISLGTQISLTLYDTLGNAYLYNMAF